MLTDYDVPNSTKKDKMWKSIAPCTKPMKLALTDMRTGKFKYPFIHDFQNKDKAYQI